MRMEEGLEFDFVSGEEVGHETGNHGCAARTFPNHASTRFSVLTAAPTGRRPFDKFV